MADASCSAFLRKAVVRRVSRRTSRARRHSVEAPTFLLEASRSPGTQSSRFDEQRAGATRVRCPGDRVQTASGAIDERFQPSRLGRSL